MSDLPEAVAPEAPAPDKAIGAAGRQARAGTTKIRLAENERDIEELIKLGIALHQESEYRDLSYDVNKRREFGRRALANRAQYGLLMAEKGSEVVGFLVGVVSEFYFSHDLAATAMTFYVKPEHRGSLAAVKLLHGFRRWAANRGVKALYVNVTSGVQMARTDRLMKHVGFKLIGGNYALRLPAAGAKEPTG